MVDKWTVGLNKEGLYNGVKPPEERGSENIKEEYWGRITVALGRTPLDTIISSKNVLLGYHLKWPIHPKTYSSDLKLSLDYVFYSPRTNSQPTLIVVRPFISPILSPTLLQIYCTGLIGPIPFFIWVWATICDLTIVIQKYEI